MDFIHSLLTVKRTLDFVDILRFSQGVYFLCVKGYTKLF